MVKIAQRACFWFAFIGNLLRSIWQLLASIKSRLFCRTTQATEPSANQSNLKHDDGLREKYEQLSMDHQLLNEQHEDLIRQYQVLHAELEMLKDVVARNKVEVKPSRRTRSSQGNLIRLSTIPR